MKPMVTDLQRQADMGFAARAAQLADDAARLATWYEGIANDYREAQRVRIPSKTLIAKGALLEVREGMAHAALLAEKHRRRAIRYAQRARQLARLV